MQLTMQNFAGAPQDLGNNDNFIDTNYMGDCVSVVVLYNYNQHSNRYQDARGWHGLGGIEAIDMAQMMVGVPDNVMTQVLIIGTKRSPYRLEQELAYVRGALQAHRNVSIRCIDGCSRTTIDRQGRAS